MAARVERLSRNMMRTDDGQRRLVHGDDRRGILPWAPDAPQIVAALK